MYNVSSLYVIVVKNRRREEFPFVRGDDNCFATIEPDRNISVSRLPLFFDGHPFELNNSQSCKLLCSCIAAVMTSCTAQQKVVHEICRVFAKNLAVRVGHNLIENVKRVVVIVVKEVVVRGCSGPPLRWQLCRRL